MPNARVDLIPEIRLRPRPLTRVGERSQVRFDAVRTSVLDLGVPSTRPQRPYNVAYYAAHREEEIERVTRRQRATLAWLRDLRRVPCLDCGGDFPPHVMDFDHRDPSTKSFPIASGKVLLKSRALLELEIAKCDVVCANCHRIRTAAQIERGIITNDGWPVPPILKPGVAAARRRERWHRRRDQQMDVLNRIRRLPCVACGGSFPTCVMEFDHRDAFTKSGVVSYLAGRVPIAKLLEEIAKCDIVCTNCHRDRTYMRRAATSDQRGCVVVVTNDFSKVGMRVRFPPPALSSDLDEHFILEQETPYITAA